MAKLIQICGAGETLYGLDDEGQLLRLKNDRWDVVCQERSEHDVVFDRVVELQKQLTAEREKLNKLPSKRKGVNLV